MKAKFISLLTAFVALSFSALYAQEAFDVVFTYPKPADMTGAVQSLRGDIVSRGGVFSGNAQEGRFSLAGSSGLYRVSGDSVVVSLLYAADANEQDTVPLFAAPKSFSFTIDKPRDIARAVDEIRNGITTKGGTFRGDEQQGAFRHSGISGQYEVTENVLVTISEKPFILTNNFVKEQITTYFREK